MFDYFFEHYNTATFYVIFQRFDVLGQVFTDISAVIVNKINDIRLDNSDSTSKYSAGKHENILRVY